MVLKSLLSRPGSPRRQADRSDRPVADQLWKRLQGDTSDLCLKRGERHGSHPYQMIFAALLRDKEEMGITKGPT